VATIREFIKRTPPFSRAVDFLRSNGFLRSDTRAIALASFVFQRVLRCNSDTPWPVHFTSRVAAPERIRLGDNVWLSFLVSGGCYIQAINGIGSDTLFAPGVKIVSANHKPGAAEAWLPAEPIRIGRNCWIGANAVILPGVQLGDRVVVGAGAVVTRSFPADSVVVGNPARALDPRSQ
jgi:acetyltransferase-like isoleucine patch superfamily enzyme